MRIAVIVFEVLLVLTLIYACSWGLTWCWVRFIGSLTAARIFDHAFVALALFAALAILAGMFMLFVGIL